MTWSSRSASATSSSVARKAATSACGSRSMKPDRVGQQQLPAARQAHLARQRVQRDEERIRRHRPLARQPVEERRLAGVGVAHQRHRGHRLLLPAIAQSGSGAAGRGRSPSASDSIRVRIRRRSVSSFVSPGPRVPMPPPSRDKAVLDPASRGSRYFSCASSTCRLPSRVRARRAKMSRMSCVRSMTLRSSPSPRCRSWLGVSSLSTTTRSTSPSSHATARLWTLPLPMKVAGSGARRSCSVENTTVAPAASTRPANSRSDASEWSRPLPPVTTPTSAARSADGVGVRRAVMKKGSLEILTYNRRRSR